MRTSDVWIGMLTAGALAAPAIGARRPRSPSAQRGRGVPLRAGPPTASCASCMDRRARLGIKVNLQARETDSIGAYVEAVTPSGPAAKAGIRSGDVITKLDGKSVLAAARLRTGTRGSRCRAFG